SRHDDVNVHAAPSASPPRTLEFTPEMRDLLRADIPSFEGDGSNDGTHNTTLDALLEAGRDVFVRLGYHGTRVDDVVAAAGLSHGGFYRYFHNKAELARILTARANRSTGTVLLEIPDPYGSGLAGSKTALRRWLRRYHAAHAHESAMLRVWVDGVLQDPALRPDYAPPIDWGRRRLVRYLEPRGFGDVDIEALVMVALLGVFGTQPRPPADIEAAAHIIERGLLGR